VQVLAQFGKDPGFRWLTPGFIAGRIHLKIGCGAAAWAQTARESHHSIRTGRAGFEHLIFFGSKADMDPAEWTTGAM
jgi:hypothetical protein